MSENFDTRVAQLSDRKQELLRRLANRAAGSPPAAAGDAAGQPAAGEQRDAPSPLVLLSEGGSDTPLYCSHAVSGSPYSYHALSRALQPQRSVYGFESPGLEGGTTPIADVVELARRYSAEVLRQQPGGAYHLLGWSMGGYVALEMGRQLTEGGRPPATLIMVDSHDPGPHPMPAEPENQLAFLNELAAVAGRPSIPDTAVEVLADAELNGLIKVATSAELVAADVPASFVQNRYRVFRANMEAMYGYQPKPFPGKLIMLQAADGEDRLGWAPFAEGGFERINVPGDHYSMWSEANVPALIETVRSILSR